MTGAAHLHGDDYPHTLRLLAALVGGRADHNLLAAAIGEPAEDIGYRVTAEGAWVDWERLAGGKFSSTEVAAIRIAWGCATLERAGGLPPRLAGIVAEVVDQVSGAARSTSG